MHLCANQTYTMEDLIKLLSKAPKLFPVYIRMYKPSVVKKYPSTSHLGYHFRRYFLRCVPQLYRNTDNTTLTSQPLNVMYTNNPSFPSVPWMCGSRQLIEEGLTRAEAVRGVPEEVQKQLEKLKVGHILCQLPPHLITDLLLYALCQVTHLTDVKLGSPPNFITQFTLTLVHFLYMLHTYMCILSFTHPPTHTHTHTHTCTHAHTHTHTCAHAHTHTHTHTYATI